MDEQHDIVLGPHLTRCTCNTAAVADRMLAASQNVLENYPSFLVLLALSSIHRPTVGGLAGLVRLAGFVVYVISYRVRSLRLRVCFMHGMVDTCVGEQE